MRLQRQWWRGLVAAVLGGLVGMTAVAAAGEQFLPVLSRREGAQRFAGIPLTDGYIAYLTLLNERDGGINGVQLVWEECETVYDVARGVECYERLKAKGSTGAAGFALADTALVNALLERATHDQIPLLAVGVGRSDAADGRVFPYVFPVPSTWWSQHTAKLRFIGQRAGGMDRLKGRKIAHVYIDNDYGRETLAILDTQAAQYGVAVQHLAVPQPGLDQKATWLRVKVAQPDWVILRTAMRHFGHQPLTGAQVQWGLEHLTLTAASLKALGAEGLLSPLSLSCHDHEGGGGVKFQQWDGTQWHAITDWIAPDQALVRPLVEASAAKYAQEKGITPRTCP